MKVLILVPIMVIFVSCTLNHKSSNNEVDSIQNNLTVNIHELSDEQLDTLNGYQLDDTKSKEQLQIVSDLVQYIENIYKKESNQIEMYLQINDEDTIFKVKNYENLPETFFASYNIIRNKNGNIIYISENPYSESGDWFLETRRYFNDDGLLLAFIGHYSTFVSECAEIAHEDSEYFFDNDFTLIKKSYLIKDDNNNVLLPAKCNIWRDSYTIERNLDEFLKVHNFTSRY